MAPMQGDEMNQEREAFKQLLLKSDMVAIELRGGPQDGEMIYSKRSASQIGRIITVSLENSFVEGPHENDAYDAEYRQDGERHAVFLQKVQTQQTYRSLPFLKSAELLGGPFSGQDYDLTEGGERLGSRVGSSIACPCDGCDLPEDLPLESGGEVVAYYIIQDDGSATFDQYL